MGAQPSMFTGQSAATQTAPLTQPVSSMTLEERLARAISKSRQYMPAEAWQQVSALVQPEALSVMAMVTSAWAVAHFFGVGEIADALLLVAGVATLGTSALQAGKEAVDFGLGAYRARSDQDLDEAGQHFGRAIVLGGVTIISALFFRGRPKVLNEPFFGGSVGRLGPGPINGRFAYRPTNSLGLLDRGVMGVTNEWGDVVVSSRLSRAEQQATFYHEQVHQFLTPKLYPLRSIRVQLSLEGYNRSYLLRYLEEALAETYSQLRTRGLPGLPEGVRFPVANGYVTLAKLGTEASGFFLGPLNVSGNMYRVYYTGACMAPPKTGAR